MGSDTRDLENARTDLVRELNDHIRRIAAANGDDAYPYTFVCECGCWGEVRLTVREFERSERVLRVGHGS